MRAVKLPKYESWGAYNAYLFGIVERFCDYLGTRILSDAPTPDGDRAVRSLQDEVPHHRNDDRDYDGNPHARA